jgi:xylulose-5-phosphate/fructose-6-phosphate phosphoketolase
MVDGKPVEDTWRAHQGSSHRLRKESRSREDARRLDENYKPEELFDKTGKFIPEFAELAPSGNRRMGANLHANGGLLLRDLSMPDFRDYAFPVSKPGTQFTESTRVLGQLLRDVMRRNAGNKNFRVFGPDETASNRLDALYEATDKVFMEPMLATDEHLSHHGRVMEVLSEHMCQGWLEGYLLTGRHGLFSCYEAFIHIIDSMFNNMPNG